MNENSELYQEPNEFSEALMEPKPMPPGELLFKQLNNDWLDQVPNDLKKDEELRLRWLRQHPFEKYLIALIILDILVLNDRTPVKSGTDELEELSAGTERPDDQKEDTDDTKSPVN